MTKPTSNLQRLEAVKQGLNRMLNERRGERGRFDGISFIGGWRNSPEVARIVAMIRFLTHVIDDMDVETNDQTVP